MQEISRIYIITLCFLVIFASSFGVEAKTQNKNSINAIEAIEKSEWKFLVADEKYIKIDFELYNLDGEIVTQTDFNKKNNIIITGSLANPQRDKPRETIFWLRTLGELKNTHGNNVNIIYVELNSLVFSAKELMNIQKQFPNIIFLHATRKQGSKINRNFGQTKTNALLKDMIGKGKSKKDLKIKRKHVNNRSTIVTVIGNSYPVIFDEHQKPKFVLLPNIELDEISLLLR